MRSTSAKTVFFMSIPIFIELILQLLVGNIDQVMLGRISEESVAAVANGNQIMNIVIILLSVMNVSTTILISQYLGANNQKRISQVCHVSLVVVAGVGFFASILLTLFRGNIFHWMKVPEAVFPLANNYLLIVGLFVVFQGVYITLAAILRSFGFMKEVMLVSTLINIVNICGNAILINGLFGLPRLGILGAAISTDISKAIGLCILIWLFGKKIPVKLSKKELHPFPTETLKNLLHIGIPSGGEELSYQLSQMYIMKFINLFGTKVINTKVYCSLLANIAFVYSIALSQATQMMVSYLMGANDVATAKKRIWSTLWTTMAIALSMTALFYLNSDTILSIFTKDPEILSLAKKILFIEFFLEIGRTINIAMTKCLVALGDVLFPVITGIIFMWTVAVGLGYYLGVHLGYGLVGIWIAMTIDEIARGCVFLIRFGFGFWEKKLPATVTK